MLLSIGHLLRVACGQARLIMSLGFDARYQRHPVLKAGWPTRSLSVFNSLSPRPPLVPPESEYMQIFSMQMGNGQSGAGGGRDSKSPSTSKSADDFNSDAEEDDDMLFEDNGEPDSDPDDSREQGQKSVSDESTRPSSSANGVKRQQPQHQPSQSQQPPHQNPIPAALHHSNFSVATLCGQLGQLSNPLSFHPLAMFQQLHHPMFLQQLQPLQQQQPAPLASSIDEPLDLKKRSPDSVKIGVQNGGEDSAVSAFTSTLKRRHTGGENGDSVSKKVAIRSAESPEESSKETSSN